METEPTTVERRRTDRRWMRVAIAASRQAEGRTSPNPPVGCCIIASCGRLLAVGHTARGGRPHAETEALSMAGEAARGGTVYVTLEPCAHTGETDPCTEALIAAGIARVVIAVRDPDPRVNGRGIDQLVEAGLSVQIDVEAEAARQVLAGFLHRVKYRRPLVTVKTASSIDGMIALNDGAKRWITGPLMRRYIHLQRSRSDALLSAIGTVLTDDPQFTCRIPGLQIDSPHRYLLDGSLKTPLEANVLESISYGGLTIFCRRDADPQKAIALRAKGADLQPIETDKNGQLDLHQVMTTIAEAGHNTLMVEAGGKLAASLLQAALIDRILWTQGLHLIGGDGIPAIGALRLCDLPIQPPFRHVSDGIFGDDRFILVECLDEID